MNKDVDNTVTLTQHLVLVKRDAMMQVPVRVFDHEIPLLQLIHGDDNIEIKDSEQVEVSNFNVDDEYDRLVRKDDASKSTAVFQIYGNNPKGLADELGIPYETKRGARVARKLDESLEVDNSLADTGGASVGTVASIVRKPKAAIVGGRAAKEVTLAHSDNRPLAAKVKVTKVAKAKAKPAGKKAK